MQDQLADSLRALVIPRGVLNWLQATVAESDLTERAARERENKRLEEQHRRIDSKLEAARECNSGDSYKTFCCHYASGRSEPCCE